MYPGFDYNNPLQRSQSISPLGYGGITAPPITAQSLAFGATSPTGPAPLGVAVAPTPALSVSTAGPSAPAYAAPIGPPTAEAAGAEAAGDMSLWDGLKGLVWDKEKGFNLEGLSSIAKGIGGLGALWGSFQQNKMAQEAFDFQKQTYLDNYANQLKSYNTSLADRTESEAVQEGRSQQWAANKINRNKL